jgi:hypothetical protein
VKVGRGAVQSHGLRFDVIRPASESLDEFKKRVSAAEWKDRKRPKAAKETRNWVVGENGRHHGSLHSDWWQGKGVDLSTCNQLAVYPVIGWWKEREHLEQYNKVARYSLIISLEAPDVDVDLYTPITNFNTVETETMV